MCRSPCHEDTALASEDQKPPKLVLAHASISHVQLVGFSFGKAYSEAGQELTWQSWSDLLYLKFEIQGSGSQMMSSTYWTADWGPSWKQTGLDQQRGNTPWAAATMVFGFFWPLIFGSCDSCTSHIPLGTCWQGDNVEWTNWTPQFFIRQAWSVSFCQRAKYDANCFTRKGAP